MKLITITNEDGSSTYILFPEIDEEKPIVTKMADNLRSVNKDAIEVCLTQIGEDPTKGLAILVKK